MDRGHRGEGAGVTPEALLAQCESARGVGVSMITLQLKRRCRGEMANVIPGVRGQVVQWGDGTWDFPSVVMVEVDAIEPVLRRAIKEREAA